MTRKIDRYVLGELGLLFVTSFGLFLTSFTAVDSVSAASKQVMKLGLGEFLYYLLLRTATFQGYVVPIAMLLACLLCFSRMAREGEVLGLRSCGVSETRLARPAVVFFVAVAIASFLIQEQVSVFAGRKSAGILARIAAGEASLFKGLTTDMEVLGDGRERLMVVHSLDLKDQRLNSVFFHFFHEGRRVEEVYARTARYENEQWKFDEIRRLTFDGHQERSRETRIGSLIAAGDLLGPLPKPEAMLSSYTKYRHFTELTQQLSQMPKTEALDTERQRLKLEIHQRLAMPASCLVLGLLAIPFGLGWARSGFGHCLGATVLVTLGYYVFSSFAVSLSEQGKLPPVMGAWSANLVFLLIGSSLLARYLRVKT